MLCYISRAKVSIQISVFVPIFRSTFPIQYFGQPAGLPHSLSSWLPIYDVWGINLPHTLLPPCPGETAWPISPTRLPTPRRVGAIQAVNMMHCILWPWWVKHWSWSVYWIDWQTLITPEQCSRKQRQNSQHKPNNVKKNNTTWIWGPNNTNKMSKKVPHPNPPSQTKLTHW